MKKNGGGGGTNWADAGGKAAIVIGMGAAAGGAAVASLGMVGIGTGALAVGAVLIIGGIIAVVAGGGASGSSGGGIGSPVSAGAGGGSDTGGAGGTPGETGCFAAGTFVTLGDGSRKAIEMVNVGDLVLSQREDGGALGVQRVAHIWEHTVQRTLLLNFRNGEQLETTKEHRFHVDGGGFVAAGKLRPGAALNTPAGNMVLRGAKERNATTQVYNLEVEKFHTYFVGDNLVWVHNKKDTESEGEGTKGEEKSDNK
jgi:Pretoxin HINT domain